MTQNILVEEGVSYFKRGKYNSQQQAGIRRHQKMVTMKIHKNHCGKNKTKHQSCKHN